MGPHQRALGAAQTRPADGARPLPRSGSFAARTATPWPPCAPAATEGSSTVAPHVEPRDEPGRCDRRAVGTSRPSRAGCDMQPGSGPTERGDERPRWSRRSSPPPSNPPPQRSERRGPRSAWRRTAGGGPARRRWRPPGPCAAGAASAAKAGCTDAGAADGGPDGPSREHGAARAPLRAPRSARPGAPWDRLPRSGTRGAASLCFTRPRLPVGDLNRTASAPR